MARHSPPDHRGPEATAGLRQRRREHGEPVSDTIVDGNDRPVLVASPIDGGDGVVGKVVEIRSVDDNEGHPPSVMIEWPEWPGDPERCETSVKDYGSEGPDGPYTYRLDDFSVIAGS